MHLLVLLISYLSLVSGAPSAAPRATVYVFLADTCPISQAVTLPLRELHGQYAARGVAFVGVFPAAATSPAALAAFAKTYQLPFALRADPGHRLTRRLRARVTPEVVVLGPDRRTVLYRGRLNDAYAGLGQHRPVTRRHELADALADVLAGRPVAVPQTEPVGCFIEPI